MAGPVQQGSTANGGVVGYARLSGYAPPSAVKPYKFDDVLFFFFLFFFFFCQNIVWSTFSIFSLLKPKTLDYRVDNQAFLVFIPLSIFTISHYILVLILKITKIDNTFMAIAT
jgi:hypothetical protein